MGTLPKVGLDAVITNLSVFQQGAKVIGKSFDTINAKADAVAKGSSGLIKALSTLGASIANVGAIAASAVAAGIAALTAGIIALGIASVKTGAEFTKAMSNVGAISGATATEFDALTASAEELGRTTKFTATEAAEGMNFLAMAGFEVNEIIGAMPGVLNLAAASNLGLGRSADIVSNILRGFNADVSETGKFVDILTATFTSSNTNLSQLGDAMKFVAPIANSLGIDVADTAAAIGKMGDAGIQGSMAGTNLRRMLLNLTAPTDKSRKLMEELGIEVFNLDGSLKTLPEIIGEVSGGVADLGEQQKIASLKTIIGVRAIAGFNVLMDEGEEGLISYGNELRNSVGRASEIAARQLDNLSGDMTLLNSAFDGLKIDIFRELEPVLRNVVKFATGLIPLIGPPLVKLFSFIASTAAPAIKAIQFAIKVFFAALSQGQSVLDSFGKAIGTLIPEELKGAVSDLVAAIGNFFSVIFGGESGLSDFEFSFEGISKAIINVANFVLPLLTNALNFLGPVIRNIIDIVGNLFDAFQEGGIGGVFDELFGGAEGLDIGSLLDPIIAGIEPLLGTLMDTISEFITGTVIPGIPTLLDGIIATITTWAATQGPAIQEAIAQWSETFWDWINPIIDNAGVVLAGIIAAIGQWALSGETQSKLTEMGIALGAMLVTGIENLAANQERMVEILTKIVTGLAVAAVVVAGLLAAVGAQIVAGIIAGIIQKITGKEIEVALITNLGTMLTNIGGQIATISSIVGQNIVLGILSGMLDLIGTLQGIWESIKAIFNVGFQFLLTATTAFIASQIEFWLLFSTQLTEGITIMWETITVIFETTLALILGIVNTALAAIIAFFTAFKAKLIALVTLIWNTIKAIISKVMAEIQKIIDTAIQLFIKAFEKLKEIVDIIKRVFNRVVAALKAGLEKMKSAMRSAVSDFKDLAKSLMDGIIQGIKSKAGDVVGALKGVIENAIKGALDILGIGSPSKVFFDMGANAGASFAQGLAALTPVINAQVQASITGPTQAAVSGPVLPSVTNNNVTVNTGGNTINTQFDQAQFDAMVLGSIQRQLG